MAGCEDQAPSQPSARRRRPVGEEMAQPRERPADGPEHCERTVAVLKVGGVTDQPNHQAERVR